MLSRSMKHAFYSCAGPLMRINGWIYRSFRAPTSGEIKVQLGPGRDNYLAGWCNVDANLAAKIDLWADLRNPLPFRDGTVTAFYSHHVIEHLVDSRLVDHFRDMYRCLKPGGVIRVGGPDGENAAKKFAAGDMAWFGDFPDKHDSIGGKFTNFIMCRGEHLTILSESYLREIASAAGFINIHRRTPTTETGYPEIFNDTLKVEFDPDLITPHTLIIEAEKPK
jgi:predicted SAM-dependent methyltransferase